MDKYLGKSYVEVGGCFGLVDLVCKDLFGQSLLTLVLGNKITSVAEAQKNDILEFGARPGHCGIVVENNQVMHADLERGVVRDPITSYWKEATITRVIK